MRLSIFIIHFLTQDKELFVKRDLVKSLLEQKKLSVDFNMCEKENKG